MLKLISSLFSYLKKEKKIQVLSEILFSYLKKIKKIHFLSGVLFLFLIIILFSIKESSVLERNNKEKISTQLEEKNSYKHDESSKNTEVEIDNSKNKQNAKDDLPKSIKSQTKEKKVVAKNELKTQQKGETKQLTKKIKNKDEIKNSNTPRK